MTNTKKKKGNKMKLLSAVGMLTVSAAMLVSSTFAWFSLNKKVSASTMNVKAKSYNPYLLINEEQGNDAASGYSTSATLMDSADDAVELKLVNPKTIAATMAWREATAATPDNYARQGDFSDVTLVANTTNPHILEKQNSTLTNDYYVLTYDLWFKTSNDTIATKLRLAEQTAAGTEADPKGITVTNVAAGKLEQAARILIVNQSNGAYALYNAGTDAITYSDATDKLAAEVNNTTPLNLKVYMYFDGEDTAAFTNNAVNLKALVATMNFVVDGQE